jgi:hypothetical protein
MEANDPEEVMKELLLADKKAPVVVPPPRGEGGIVTVKKPSPNMSNEL